MREIGLDLEFLGRAAPAVDRDDAGHRGQPAQRDPILHGAQIGESEMRRPDDLVAVDLADETRLLDLRDLIARKLHVLLQAERRLRVGEVVIDAVLERDPHERQAVEGGRADVVDAGRRIEPDLHRRRVVLLHLLGGEAGGLRGDLENDRRGIGIRLDIELDVGGNTGRDEDEHAEQDDRPAAERESDDGSEHPSLSAATSRSGRAAVQDVAQENGAAHRDGLARRSRPSRI